MALTVITAAALVQKMEEGELAWPPFLSNDGHIYARSVKIDPSTGRYFVYQV